MVLMHWYDKYSVGNDIIDKQHQKLIILINTLYDATEISSKKETIGHVFKELVDYTHTHFRYEEALMKQCNYPDFEEHRKKHHHFIDERMRGVVHFITVIALDILLSFLGAIVVAFFSRFREYRADRGGAELAGREKMIMALEGLKRTVELANVEKRSALNTLKISGKQGGLVALFASHPPLDLRIEALKKGRI